MDDSGHRENGRHKPLPGQWLMQHQPSMKQIMAIMAERDSALQERNLAVSEKKAALAERDMAISTLAADISEADSAIVVDYRGRYPVDRSKSGSWRSSFFIIGVELAERFAYYGISSNLISYHIIIMASLLYILGLGLLSLSALLPSDLSSPDCQTGGAKFIMSSCSPPQFQVILFFFSLYLIAFAQGGHMPCVQAFGADQFDGQDSEECRARSSFFNWWYFGLVVGPHFSWKALLVVFRAWMALDGLKYHSPLL